MERTSVCVHAWDEILSAGVVSHLRTRPELRVLSRAESEEAQVALVVVDEVDEDTLQLIRRVARSGTSRVVLVAGTLADSDLVTAIEAGAVGLMRRREASPDHLVSTIRGASTGEGAVPADLLGRLLSQVGTVQRGMLAPRGLSWNGLAAREVEVLRLIADGCDTSEVAQRLAYSERTVKNVLHDVTTRLQLRNRSHAVAYALREGLI